MKRFFTIGLCVVCALAGVTVFVSRASSVAHAQGTCTISKTFGTLRGATPVGLLFEASDGTIRLVDVDKNNCPLTMTIQRR